jgi:hypothetical protein
MIPPAQFEEHRATATRMAKQPTSVLGVAIVVMVWLLALAGVWLWMRGT